MYTERHNRVLHRIADLVRRSGKYADWTVLVDEPVEMFGEHLGKLANQRPDLTLIAPDKSMILALEVSVVYADSRRDTMGEPERVKLHRYDNWIARLLEHEAVSHARVLPITVASQGIVPHNVGDTLLKPGLGSSRYIRRACRWMAIDILHDSFKIFKTYTNSIQLNAERGASGAASS